MVNRHRFKFVLVLIVFAVALAFSCIPATSAKASPPRQTTPPQQIRISVYILRIGQFDLASSSYIMDFYLDFDCDQPCDTSKFEIMNGRELVRVTEQDSPTYKSYRIQAQLSANFDLRNYPFDKHDLKIIIEDQQHNNTQFIYVKNPELAGMDKDLIVSGWKVSSEWDEKIDDHYYGNYKVTYSRYTFSVKLIRPPLAGVLKGILPAIFIVSVGFLCLLIAPQKDSQRITLNTSSLIGSVLYHLSLTSAVPPVGYLTFADRFMLINYLALVLLLFYTLIIMIRIDNKMEKKIQDLHKSSRIVVPSIWLILQLINIVYVFI